MPSALSQNGGESLGAQAGPARLTDVITSGGLSGVRGAVTGCGEHGGSPQSPGMSMPGLWRALVCQ